MSILAPNWISTPLCEPSSSLCRNRPFSGACHGGEKKFFKTLGSSVMLCLLTLSGHTVCVGGSSPGAHSLLSSRRKGGESPTPSQFLHPTEPEGCLPFQNCSYGPVSVGDSRGRSTVEHLSSRLDLYPLRA